MKQNIFNQYAEKVCDIFSIEDKSLFEKNKRKDVVDARHLLYFLCAERPMKIVYIQEYMAEKGYIINHTSILYGIRKVTERVKTDKDYVKVIKDIKKCDLV
jgi:chromosomal replication initiation ATPase DnaA